MADVLPHVDVMFGVTDVDGRANEIVRSSGDVTDTGAGPVGGGGADDAWLESGADDASLQNGGGKVLADPQDEPTPSTSEGREPAGSRAQRVLTDVQRRMLAFERLWWRHAGSKEQAIREQFNLSATRYYKLLNQLLDMPEALAFDPIVVGRLRRLRASRTRTRLA